MVRFYQERDHEVIDYQMVDPCPTPYGLRGPRLLMGRGPKLVPKAQRDAGQKVIAFLGAAQTFGCFVERPFPTIVGQNLGVRWTNLGVGGAGPSHFTRVEAYRPLIEQADLVVVQVMSGRSTTNSIYDNPLGFETLRHRETWQQVPAEQAWRDILTHSSHAEIMQLRAETLDSWVNDYRELSESLTCPTILFWFSQRSEYYVPSTGSVYDLFGGYPQLVDEEAVKRIRPMFDEYVSYFSREGLPQPLLSRFSGKPTVPLHRAGDGSNEATTNNYYPSPAMHAAAAETLTEVCSRALGLSQI